MHMAASQDKTASVLRLARKAGVLHAREVRALGIHAEYLRRLCAKGLLDRVGRGRYVLPGAQISVHHGLALAAKAVPKGVVCLLSALQFHGIGTQAPRAVWMALDRRAARPHVDYPRLRVARFSGSALSQGVETHVIDGVPVKVYSVAKTVADCFKYRNKIGLDVALEALRECRRRRRCSMDELWRYANVCRVQNVMRPYLEVLA